MMFGIVLLKAQAARVEGKGCAVIGRNSEASQSQGAVLECAAPFHSPTRAGFYFYLFPHFRYVICVYGM